MTEYASTLAEELEQRGEVGSYVWKPNRLYAKRGNYYEPADTVSDGSAFEVAAAVTERGQEQIAEINALAAAQKALIASNERDYNVVRASLLQTYRRMSDYFANQGMTELKNIVDAAIRQL